MNNATEHHHTDTDTDAGTDAGTDTDFMEFAQESRGILRELERLAGGWGLTVAVRSFEDIGLEAGNAGGLYLSQGSAAEFGLQSATALVSLEACRQQPSGYWGDMACSILAHEMAHATVDRFEQLRGRDPLRVPREVMRRVLAMTPDEVAGVYRRQAVPPWEGHGIEFLRAAAHVSYRLAAAGFWAAPHWTIPNVYSLSPATWYFGSLESEPEALAHRPIGEVLSQPVPIGMVELFNADVTRWCRRQEQQQHDTDATDTDGNPPTGGGIPIPGKSQSPGSSVGLRSSSYSSEEPSSATM
jgi:hypothetical protein